MGNINFLEHGISKCTFDPFIAIFEIIVIFCSLHIEQSIQSQETNDVDTLNEKLNWMKIAYNIHIQFDKSRVKIRLEISHSDRIQLS